PTTLADPVVPPVRAKLFGAWEMNWLAYNDAHDVKLPGSSRTPIGFLMYPQAETAKERVASLDPDGFKYTITAKEIKALAGDRDRASACASCCARAWRSVPARPSCSSTSATPARSPPPAGA